MKRYMLVIVLALLTTTVAADPVTASWTNATQNTNGTPFTDLTGTRAEWGTCTGTAFGTMSGFAVAQGAATSLTTPNLAAGTWCFRAAHQATGGRQSAWSATVVHVVLPSIPNPPTGLTTVSTVAYERLWWGGLRQVGIVALGTPCGERLRYRKQFARIEGAVEITRRYHDGPLYGRCA